MSARSKRKQIKQIQKKIFLIVAVVFIVICVLVEGLSHIPGTRFKGWSDVFAWFGMPQPHVTEQGELQVHFIDVGNADCILVRLDGHNMLIDTGEAPREQAVIDYLDRHKIEKLDLVICTHPHVDHMGMMDAVIRHLPIERFVMSYMPEGKEPTSGAYMKMLDALEDCNVPVELAEPGTVYELGDAKVQILSPLPLDEVIEDANQVSVVSRLTYGEHSFLFTGDAEMDLEERLVASGYDLSATVLKVAHHGSKTSTSPAFLRAVSPQYAVISCGRNEYGHPSMDVISRLSSVDAQVYRTDVCGDIVFVSDGHNLSVKTARGE